MPLRSQVRDKDVRVKITDIATEERGACQALHRSATPPLL